MPFFTHLRKGLTVLWTSKDVYIRLESTRGGERACIYLLEKRRKDREFQTLRIQNPLFHIYYYPVLSRGGNKYSRFPSPPLIVLSFLSSFLLFSQPLGDPVSSLPTSISIPFFLLSLYILVETDSQKALPPTHLPKHPPIPINL